MRPYAVWLVLSLTVAPLVLLTAAVTLVVLLAVCVALGQAYGPTLSLLLTAGGLAVSFAVGVGAHEAGHVLGGGMVGWAARFVRVGPVTWMRRDGGWRLGWRRRSNWLSGIVESAPGPPDAWRLVVFLLAGPAANFVVGAIALGVVVAPMPLLPRCAAELLALVSLGLGAWSLVPLRERGQASDGLNLWRLLRHGALPLTTRRIAFEPVARTSIRRG
jgi:hypothetical protein